MICVALPASDCLQPSPLGPRMSWWNSWDISSPGKDIAGPQSPGVVKKQQILSPAYLPALPHPTPKAARAPWCPATSPGCGAHCQPLRRKASRAGTRLGFQGLHQHGPGTDSGLGQVALRVPEVLDSEPPSRKQVYKEENQLWRDRSQLIWAIIGALGNERQPRGVDDRGGGQGPRSRSNYSLS